MVLPIAEQNPCRTVCALLLLIDLSPFEQYLLPFNKYHFEGIPNPYRMYKLPFLLIT